LQIDIPIFGAALGNSVMHNPSKALALFAPISALEASIITIKAIGPDGTNQRLTLSSNFSISSVLLMAQKAFKVPYACELCAIFCLLSFFCYVTLLLQMLSPRHASGGP
jgi:hypothetical protein